MKKLSVVTAIVGMFMVLGAQTASAQQAGYGMAGCGLGSLVFGEQAGFIQIFAATTNGTFATQTFGITSGTSNCVERGVVRQSAEQEAFFEANYANIKSDMVSGQGEHLEAVASLFGCSAESHAKLASFSQENYQTIVPNEATTSMQALYTYKMAISLDDKLAESCVRI